MKRNCMKWIKRVSAVVLALCVCMLPCFKGKALATEVENRPIIMLEKYSVTNDKIVPGEDFTLTLYLKNCNESVDAENIMLDIGVGFGKTYEQNIEVIKNISKIKRDNVALLTALSLKRVVGTATNTEKEDRLFGTISANSLAIANGTDFIRVHNVKEAVLGAKMADALVRG